MDHLVWDVFAYFTFGLPPLSADDMRLVMAVGTADELDVVTTSDTLMLASSSSTKSIEVTSGVP